MTNTFSISCFYENFKYFQKCITFLHINVPYFENIKTTDNMKYGPKDELILSDKLPNLGILHFIPCFIPFFCFLSNFRYFLIIRLQ